ncbi:hypothetical protein [Vibrio vulnificus]|uniref:hypothetical protein n=1 Tax=Vibrio vulnificus TaxID=672 RepID=UPI00159417F0|nr:hypothetical protein [Vibrio vulnificus]EHR6437326.1 hypothetical protein [Vibrio parahaemolyticus]EHR6585551.1 hypothetical protein [Vibrio parahaemolyticus]EHZ2493196.1 hypothetical protein [Vibrio parahaemolyticus]EIY6411588.1 hypothetical protein [Vibrio parahaemolyticus]EJB1765494.1 hypothetical protein [Vibrio parahaemolyticus]
MSNQNLSNESKGTPKAQSKLIWIGAFIVLLFLLANKESNSESSVSKTTIPKGVVSSGSCIDKIHGITLYDRSRLKYTGSNDSIVYVNYKNDHGRVHKFRCSGPEGTVELFAEGAGIWMAM